MQEATRIIVERSLNPIVALWRKPLVQAFFADPITLIAGGFLAIILSAVILAPLASPHDYRELQMRLRHLPPVSSGTAVIKGVGVPDVKEERFYLLGTDHLGRDMVSRLIYGGRVSITVGVVGVLVSGSIGIFLGLIAGYYRGIIDDVIMRVVDVFMSVPLLFIALMVLFILGPSFITRGVVMSLREQTFVEAARAIGAKDQRIITRHILPNLITPLLTIAALEVPRNILTESALSFLGFGIQPPESSWGLMLSAGREYITTAWWIVVIPGVAIFVTCLSFNLFGVWLRAVSDPLQRWRWLKQTKESKEAGIIF